jgi:thiol-disulfide isomerase/thioredoxin
MLQHPECSLKALFPLILCFLLLAGLLAGCSAVKKVAVKPNEHMEVGWTPRSIFQSPVYAVWFDSSYAAYEPDASLLNHLRTMRDSVELVVVFGTWCSDSRRELPRFWKIEDSVHLPAGKITMIAVDRTMDIPQGIRKEYNITNVPTFIVLYRGLEMGRIVESPRVSLEQDIVNMLAPVFGQ